MKLQDQITEINILNKHWLPHLEEEYPAPADEYLARGPKFEEGVYYHNSLWEEERDSILQNGFDFKKARNIGKGFGRGLFCGRDRDVIMGFYTSDLSKPDDYVITIKGDFNFISLTDPDNLHSFRKSFDSPALMKYWLVHHNYDGIRYYDPYCTGEEFVIYNLEGACLS